MDEANEALLAAARLWVAEHEGGIRGVLEDNNGMWPSSRNGFLPLAERAVWKAARDARLHPGTPRR